MKSEPPPIETLYFYAVDTLHYREKIKREPPPFRFLGIHIYSGYIRRLPKYLAKMDSTILNCAVIDLKDDFGHIIYDSEIEFARKIGALRKRIKIEDLINLCEEHHILPIARVVCFVDEPLSCYQNGKFALKKYNGEIWQDAVGRYWTDPTEDTVVWYNLKVIEELCQKGIRYIHLDYVRFPSFEDTLPFYKYRGKGKISRKEAISNFISKADSICKIYGAKLGVCIFGYTVWWGELQAEGQSLSQVENVDFVCPMLYPSHFGKNFLKKKYPWERDYEIVYQSIKLCDSLLNSPEIIAYIQGFDYKAYDFSPEYIENQIQAVFDAGASGFIIWHAISKYDAVWKIKELRIK